MEKPKNEPREELDGPNEAQEEAVKDDEGRKDMEQKSSIGRTSTRRRNARRKAVERKDQLLVDLLAKLKG